MDIAAIPIVEFLKYCKNGAKNKGYYWIVYILSRASDSKELYISIKKIGNIWMTLLEIECLFYLRVTKSASKVSCMVGTV